MICAEKVNKFGIKTIDCWFCNNHMEVLFLKADEIRVAGASDIFKGFKLQKKCGVQNTLITYLDSSEDEIFAGFNSTVRNEIRKADKNGVQYIVYKDKIDSEIKEKFLECYYLMYTSKGIRATSPLWSLNLYERKNALTITVAYYNNEAYVYHVYINDGKYARLLYSCSDFRNEKNLKQLIGNANKGLHYFDIKYYKNNGYTYVDFWGGVISFEEPTNIDRFKMAFGGMPATYYNLTKFSKKGKLFNMLKGLLKM